MAIGKRIMLTKAPRGRWLAAVGAVGVLLSVVVLNFRSDRAATSTLMVLFDQTLSHRLGNRCRTVGDPELFVHVLDVGFHRRDAEKEGRRDLWE